MYSKSLCVASSSSGQKKKSDTDTIQMEVVKQKLCFRSPIERQWSKLDMALLDRVICAFLF